MFFFCTQIYTECVYIHLRLDNVARYIDYNVKKLAKPGAISRHTDNDSMVTMVVPELSGDAAGFLVLPH